MQGTHPHHSVVQTEICTPYAGPSNNYNVNVVYADNVNKHTIAYEWYVTQAQD